MCDLWYTQFALSGCTKKEPFTPRGYGSYQKQYFAKIFPSLLVSTLHIHFYFHLKKSSENALWIAIVLKSATFSASESAPDTALETTYFMLFLKNVTKFGEKADDRICFDRIDQFYTNFLFPACYFFCYWEKFPNHAWLAKNCVYEATLFFFFPKHFRLFLFIKNYC